MPKFVLLLRDAGRFDPNMSPAEMQAIVQRYIAWRANVQKNGSSIMGHKLHDKQGRVLNGNGGGLKITDGPYAEGAALSRETSRPGLAAGSLWMSSRHCGTLRWKLLSSETRLPMHRHAGHAKRGIDNCD